jgi:hypothetical protein
MAYSEFFMDIATGSNLNAGSGAGSGALGSGAALYSSASGDWDGTSQFTPNDGSTPASSLTPNVDWLSIYPNGNTTTPYSALITSITAGANGPITCSTTAKFGTAPTSSSGSHNRSCKGGGAWADFAMCGTGVALNTGTVGLPTRVNVKAGTYANTTSSRTCTMVGLATAHLWFRGFKANPGDQDGNYAAVAGTDIPSMTFTSGGWLGGGSLRIFSNIDVTGASTSSSLWNGNAASELLYNMRFRQTAGSTVRCVEIGNANSGMIGCYVSALSTQNCILLFSSSNTLFLGNYITGGNLGINGGSGIGCLVLHNIFDQIGGDVASFTTGNSRFVNNSIYAPTGHGITWSGTPVGACDVINNHFEGVNQSGKAAINNGSGTASTLIRPVANSYYDCATTIAGQGDVASIFDLGTLGASGYTDAGTHNFYPSAALIAKAAFPGYFENMGGLRGYLVPGAIQPTSGGGGGGGGGGLLINPGFGGGFR